MEWINELPDNHREGDRRNSIPLNLNIPREHLRSNSLKTYSDSNLFLRSTNSGMRSYRAHAGRSFLKVNFGKPEEKLKKNCMHTAVKERDKSFIKYLIDKKFDYVFQPDESGRTPAHIAVDKKDLAMLTLLLSKREAINVQ